MEKFFFGVSIGANLLADSDNKDMNFAGFELEGRIGWKQDLLKEFFVEPSMGWVVAKSSAQANFVPVGWQLGISAGYALPDFLSSKKPAKKAAAKKAKK
jgi:hypothetical protein